MYVPTEWNICILQNMENIEKWRDWEHRMRVFSASPKLTIVSIAVHFLSGLSLLFLVSEVTLCILLCIFPLFSIWPCTIHFPHVIKNFVKIALSSCVIPFSGY